MPKIRNKPAKNNTCVSGRRPLLLRKYYSCYLLCICCPEPAPQRVYGIAGVLQDTLTAGQQRKSGGTTAVPHQQQECYHRRQR